MANILSRQKRLVKYLAVAKQPLTAKELAGTLEVSTKTVRNDIQQINLSLDSNKIVSKNGIAFTLRSNWIMIHSYKWKMIVLMLYMTCFYNY